MLFAEGGSLAVRKPGEEIGWGCKVAGLGWEPKDPVIHSRDSVCLIPQVPPNHEIPIDTRLASNCNFSP